MSLNNVSKCLEIYPWLLLRRAAPGKVIQNILSWPARVDLPKIPSLSVVIPVYSAYRDVLGVKRDLKDVSWPTSLMSHHS